MYSKTNKQKGYPDSQEKPQIVQEEAERVFRTSNLPCAQNMATLNVVRGCVFDCRFCPEKFRKIPPNTLYLNTDMPSRLQEALSRAGRSKKMPQTVLFNNGSDPFQPFAPVLTVVYECLHTLLEAGISVNLKSRALIPNGFESLFRKHSDLLQIDVALLSMDAHMAKIYEPGAPPPQERLESFRRLIKWGVPVRARIEPLIPFVSDTASHLEELVRHLRSTGVEQAVASYLVLHPKVLEKLRTNLPAAHFRLIKGNFKGQAWQQVGVHQMTRLLPKRTRRDGYDRLARICERNGLELSICSCQNPAMGQDCIVPKASGDDREQREPGQMDLFGSA